MSLVSKLVGNRKLLKTGVECNWEAMVLDVPQILDANASPWEDDELLRALQEGTESAYEALIARFQTSVYNLVCRLLCEPSDAADVVQEVFLKVFRSIGNFRGQSSLKTWIYRISVNEAYNHRRWFSRHRRQEVGLEAEEEGNRRYQDTLPDTGQSPFDFACSREAHAFLESALAELNPAFRAAVVLRDVEDLSYEEIADILQISLGTVKSRILRGRESLRKILTSRLKPEPAVAWSPQPAVVKS
jgi:RNA polymerase sigma-70 factor (ECF subfamily)